MILLLLWMLLLEGYAMDVSRNDDQYKDNFYNLHSSQYEQSAENDLKERFFRQMKAHESDFKNVPKEYYDDIPRPGGFQTQYSYLFDNNGPPTRQRRSLKYKVLPSPGLQSHFKIELPKKMQKRSADQVGLTGSRIPTSYDLQFIQGTASNKDVVSENYTKSVVEEVTRTATIAGHLPSYDSKFILGTISNKHSAPQKAALEATTGTERPELVFSKHLGQPLEIAVLDTANETFTGTTQQPQVLSSPLPDPVQVTPEINLKHVLAINDFIRFRREAATRTINVGDPELSDIKIRSKRKEDSVESVEKLQMEARHLDNIAEESVIEDRVRPKREKNIGERSGKMLMASSDPMLEGNREPRGATKEQWVKQPYPIHTQNGNNNNNNHFEDNNSAGSEGVRAPRVHFVTQRRSESAPQPTYHYYERDGRSRDLSRGLPRELSRENSREMERDYYHRASRHYNSPTNYNPRYNPYRHREDNPRDRRYEHKYEPYDYEREQPVYNKQRRIIYYATLPEVVRTPPNVDLRDRYSYRSRLDDRYITSSPVSVAGSDPYRNRKPYPVNKSRYEEIERPKAPYPLKVSTDVNVREIKKSPERRIYFEADRRYAYKAPSYQNEGDTYERHL